MGILAFIALWIVPGFYGLAATAALWATWHDSDYRWISYALLTSWTCSNLAWFTSDMRDRAGLYTALEVLVSIAAFVAWSQHRSRWLVALVLVSAVSITANIAFASIIKPEQGQIHLFEVATNACFFLECVITFSLGIAHGNRADRIYPWSRRRRLTRQHHAARQASGDRE